MSDVGLNSNPWFTRETFTNTHSRANVCKYELTRVHGHIPPCLLSSRERRDVINVRRFEKSSRSSPVLDDQEAFLLKSGRNKETLVVLHHFVFSRFSSEASSFRHRICLFFFFQLLPRSFRVLNVWKSLKTNPLIMTNVCLLVEKVLFLRSLWLQTIEANECGTTWNAPSPVIVACELSCLMFIQTF